MLLAGKVAIVTGAGSGIGRASAVRFAAEGASVVVSDIRGPKADETVAMIADDGGTAVSCQADVSRADDVERMVATAVDAFGGLDALFNNAGTIRPGTAVRLSEDDWDLVMAVNVRSVFLGAKYAVPAMVTRGGGAIVSTASVSGLNGDPGGVVYSASKAAVINLTRALAVDHARQHIRVNCICPGAIDTPPVERMLADAEARARSERAHPLGRIGRPEEIAAAAVWLCSDESSFVTGHALVVDGGLSAQSHLTGMADPRPAHLRGSR
jgi:NAD(P)-dependent dehydrogenase (short-subunit alcohol dehydrogenase family)